GIIGLIDVILENNAKQIPGEIKKQLGKVSELSKSLKIQVNTILDLAKSHKGELRLKNQVVSLDQLRREADILAESLCLKSRGMVYESKFVSNESEVPFIGDYEKCFTIIRNLLSNAFKFTDDRKENKVTLTLERSGNSLVMEVKDQGIGIPESYREKIFDEFVQVQDGAGRAYEGSGLGLAMVRDLVRLMNGKIELETGKGEGSRFKIVIPSHPEESLDAASSGEIQMELERKHSFHSVKGGEGASPMDSAVHSSESKDEEILIVDDSEINCEIISEILKNDGFRVSYELSGAKGLDRMRACQPRLLLLDMMMPKVSGEDVLNAMKEDKSLRNIPVMVITARASEEDRIHGLSLGADDYLAKPIIPEELRLRVRNILERQRILRYAEQIEGQRRIIQLGELFGDLSHEIKNILACSSGSKALTIEDIKCVMKLLSLGDHERSLMAESFAMQEEEYDCDLNRAFKLGLEKNEKNYEILKTVRIFLAQSVVSDTDLALLWESIKGLSTSELVFFETLLNIISRFQALVKVAGRTTDLALSVLALTRQNSSEKVSLKECMRQLEILVGARLRSNHVSWNLEIEDVILNITRSELLQILLNLTINALDAMGSIKDDEKWIKIYSRKERNSSEIRMTNAGKPIPPELSEKVFERGFSTKGEAGTGIGLHVSRRLARQSGGDLVYDVESDHPCFVLKLNAASTIAA
ncbi:MAG: response regulator, partial [Oligoflexales bacterium]|nr:response regulator [Oligoflexales bacterium]